MADPHPTATTTVDGGAVDVLATAELRFLITRATDHARPAGPHSNAT